MTPASFIRGYIQAHEGGLSLDPADTGNWHHRRLVGSKYGVTGDVLAAFCKVTAVTPAQMAALTLDEAVQIGLSMFYQGPHFDLAPWDQCIASAVDMAWGAGPGQAIKLLQRMIGANDDGQMGPYTARAYRDFVANHGVDGAARAFAGVRNTFYDQIVKVRPTNSKFLNGWRNRTASFLPGTPWWNAWSTT